MFSILKFLKRRFTHKPHGQEQATNVKASTQAQQTIDLSREPDAERKKSTEDTATMKSDFLQRFDNIVTNSELGQSVRIETQPRLTNTSDRAMLQYDSKRQYNKEYIHSLICSSTVPQSEKMSFVRAALADENSTVMENFPTLCPCVKEQPELGALLDSFWKDYTNNADPKRNDQVHAHLNYVTQNQLLGYETLINNYFAKRPPKGQRNIEEAMLPYYLATGGHTQRALELTQLLVEEVERGERDYLSINDYSNGIDLFSFLYFELDEPQKLHVIDLAFRYCQVVETGYWNTGTLQAMLKKVDLERYHQLMWNHLDRSEIQNLDKDGKNRAYTNLVMLHWLETMGNDALAYWQRFVRSRPMWFTRALEHPEEEFESSLLSVASRFAANMTKDHEKRQVVQDIIDNHRFLRADSELMKPYFVHEFIIAITGILPQLTDADIRALIPTRYHDDEDGWRSYIQPALNSDKTIANKELPVRRSLNELLSLFQSHGFYESRKNSALDEFISSSSYFNDAYRMIDDTGQTIRQAGDLCTYPVRYDEFYYQVIYPILVHVEGTAPALEQQNEESKVPLVAESDEVRAQMSLLRKSEEDHTDEIAALNQRFRELQTALGNYQLAVTGDACTRIVNIMSDADRYELRPLFHLINLALADNKSQLRIIQLVTGDETEWMGIFNPDQICPLLLELDIYGFADNYNDGLMPLPAQYAAYYY